MFRLNRKIEWDYNVSTLNQPLFKVVADSFDISFDSKQPKLEPKQVSALSETKCFSRLFRFFIETASFHVSIKPKLTETSRYIFHWNCRKGRVVVTSLPQSRKVNAYYLGPLERLR
jgi:hypothetical protein